MDGPESEPRGGLCTAITQRTITEALTAVMIVIILRGERAVRRSKAGARNNGNEISPATTKTCAQQTPLPTMSWTTRPLQRAKFIEVGLSTSRLRKQGLVRGRALQADRCRLQRRFLAATLGNQ